MPLGISWFMVASPIDRLRRFRVDRELNHGALAVLCGCSQPQISRVLAGKRGVGIALAAGIERATKGWAGGQIKATEWDGYKPKVLAA